MVKDWDTMFADKIFITDIGTSQKIEIKGKNVEIGRYAVFSPNKNQKGHQAIEISDDYEMLCKKYKITSDYTCVVEKPS